MRYKIIFTLFLCLVGIIVGLIFKIPVLKATSFDSKEPSFQKFYIVKPGDTLLNIGEKYRVNVSALAAVNEILDYNLIESGQVLNIPGKFITHRVAKNENLTKIAAFYRVDIDELKIKNKITNEDIILTGQQLIIPLLAGNENENELDTTDSAGNTKAKTNSNWTIGQMSWPVIGWISSPFGLRDGRVHEGLDIATVEGEPVYAVRAGQVIFAGPRGTYGLTVIIDHGAGLTTLYAHASSLLVQENDWVKEGQFIARVGSTGHSNGPHLHFEVRLNEIPYDPLHFLAHISA